MLWSNMMSPCMNSYTVWTCKFCLNVAHQLCTDIFIPFLDFAEGTLSLPNLHGWTSFVDDNHAGPFLFTSLAAIIPNYTSLEISLSVTWAQAIYYDKSSYYICLWIQSFIFALLGLKNIYWFKVGFKVEARKFISIMTLNRVFYQCWIAAISGCMCFSERDPDFILPVRIGHSLFPVLRVQPKPKQRKQTLPIVS